MIFMPQLSDEFTANRLEQSGVQSPRALKNVVVVDKTLAGHRHRVKVIPFTRNYGEKVTEQPKINNFFEVVEGTS